MRLIILLLVPLAAAPAAAQSDLCASPSQYCGAKLPAQCLTKIGAGSIATAGPDCPAALAAYRDCLMSVSERCGGAPDNQTIGAAAPRNQSDQSGDWVRQFDGRIGKIAVANPTLYPIQVSLWHPDNQLVFGRWLVEGQSEIYLALQGDAFSIGNDWGIQFGDAPARSIGEATEWNGGEWRASPNSFFQ